MVIYLDLVILLNLLVDFMLLMGTNRLSGFPPCPGRCVLASVWGGIYGGACLLPGFRFLSGLFWRVVFLFIIGWLAYGSQMSAFRRTSLFVVLSMALGGISLSFNKGNWVFLIAASGAVWFLCRVAFRYAPGSREYVPLGLEYGGKKIIVTALRDTGNSLRDPVSGDAVYLVGPEIAVFLTGLTSAQLRDPFGTVMDKPVNGLKLIPYKAVGQENGMLLGLRLDSVRVNSREQRAVVAFVPEGLGNNGEYQALVTSG